MDDYFRALTDQPMMAQALWTTMQEPHMAGMRADNIPSHAFVSRAKHQELRALLAAYEAFLVTEKRGDMATGYAEAVQHPDWCPIQAADAGRPTRGRHARHASRCRRWGPRVSRCGPPRRAHSTAPPRFLHDAVADLYALGSFRCPLPVALRFVHERVKGVTVGRDRSRPGYLHVSTLTHAALPNRSLLFIVGLQEGRVFPAAVEDPVLLDSERQGISAALQCSSDQIDEAVHAALARLALVDTAAGYEVCLSYRTLRTPERVFQRVLTRLTKVA